MKRKTALAVGLVLTATTVVLLAYAARQVVYLFSFNPDSRQAAAESKSASVDATPFGEITLSWDTVPGAQTYNLYWSTRPGVTRHSANKIAGVAPPFRFTRVENGRTYFFVVTAVTRAGESRESEEIVYRAKP